MVHHGNKILPSDPSGLTKAVHFAVQSVVYKTWTMLCYMDFYMGRLNSGNCGIFFHSEFYLMLSSRIGSILKIIQNDTNIGH